jgi:hypothetical protein
MKSKYNYCLLFFLVALFQAQSQTYKFVATGFSVMEKNEKGEWGKWSDLKETSIIISLDTTKNRFLIYSQEIQLYEILSYEEKEENETDLIYPFTCKDDDGVPFTLSIITRKSQNNRKQLYLDHKNFIVVYNIVNYAEKGER